MTMMEACKLWIGRDFSNIPTSLIKKAYADDPESLELLSSEWPELDFPAAWGTMFKPDDPFDRDWIRNNVDKVEDAGFIVYESEECGILLGVDGCGYCFWTSHWLQLYKARGLLWHDDEEEEDNS